MTDLTAGSPTREPRPKRHKIDLACDTCRTRKVKCDGNRPACGNCVRRSDLKCNYAPASSERLPKQEPNEPQPGLRIPVSTNPPTMVAPVINPIIQGQTLSLATGPPLRPVAGRQDTSPVSPAVKGELPALSGIDSMTTVLEDGESTQQYFGSSSAGSFTQRIKVAIDAKLGVHTPTSTGGMAMATTTTTATTSTGQAPSGGTIDYTLPPRRTADRLVGVYWFYVDPLYPFLDRAQWEQAYEGIFAGAPMAGDERLFVTTLNVIFALSTQLLESLDSEHRDDSSDAYFRKAQDLLRLNLWDPGSLELVQCLLLMSQYLQSTSFPHQMWMVVGAAVRTAQSLGLHLAETTEKVELQRRELSRRLWYGCVLMDRMVALTHGRPAMISHKVATEVPLPLSTKGANPHCGNGPMSTDFSRIAFFARSIELYELMNRTILSGSSGGIARRFKKDPHAGAPECLEEDLGTILALDEALSQWEQRVPDHLRLGSPGSSDDEISKRQAVILRIRFFQARILLLRPVLFRCCLDAPTPPAPPASDDSLSQRVVRECTLLCVATAQNLISILATHQPTDGTVGLLPAWWYRVYYVFTAATILVVAKLRPELFDAQGVLRSWDQALLVLEAHEKFGPSARRCVAVLEILSDKVFRVSGAAAAAASGQMASEVLEDQGDEYMDGIGEYADVDLGGLDFDASDFNAFNAEMWSLLNQN